MGPLLKILKWSLFQLEFAAVLVYLLLHLILFKRLHLGFPEVLVLELSCHIEFFQCLQTAYNQVNIKDYFV